MRLRTLCLTVALTSGLVACSSAPAGSLDAGNEARDASVMTQDASFASDASVPHDSGVPRRTERAECRDAGGVDYCPGFQEELCRLEAIRQEFAQGCSADAECEKAPYASNCLSYGLCEPQPSILASRRDAFAAEVAADLAEYCGSVNCGVGGGSCAVMPTRSACVDGGCTTLRE